MSRQRRQKHWQKSGERRGQEENDAGEIYRSPPDASHFSHGFLDDQFVFVVVAAFVIIDLCPIYSSFEVDCLEEVLPRHSVLSHGAIAAAADAWQWENAEGHRTIDKGKTTSKRRKLGEFGLSMSARRVGSGLSLGLEETEVRGEAGKTRGEGKEQSALEDLWRFVKVLTMN